MSTNIKPGNRRLLEAVEYIDEGMILDALSVLRLPKEECAEPIQTWKTPFKHWKQFTALAACMVLLAFSAPIFSYFSRVIGNWGAGAGSENSTEIAETPETTNGMYDEYILTEEDLAELNEAYFVKKYVEDPNYAGKDEAFFDNLREQLKDNKYTKFALSIEHAMERSTDHGRNFYFGKYSDCIVIVIHPGPHLWGSTMWRSSYDLGEYTFYFACARMLVCYNSKFYTPIEAYELGFITDSDVKAMHEFYLEGYCRSKQNEASN